MDPRWPYVEGDPFLLIDALAQNLIDLFHPFALRVDTDIGFLEDIVWRNLAQQGKTVKSICFLIGGLRTDSQLERSAWFGLIELKIKK